MGLQSLERRLERMVDGVFRRAFRSRVRPLELGRRLIPEMDTAQTVDAEGRRCGPNRFVVQLHPDDLDELAPVRDVLISELAEAAREYARSEDWVLPGPVSVELTAGERLRVGQFQVTASVHEPGRQPAGGALVLASGERVALAAAVVGLGRLPTCDVVLADPNASRRHAEVRPTGGGWAVVDLGSTNGTRVNGLPVMGERLLADGDLITIGATSLRFEAR